MALGAAIFLVGFVVQKSSNNPGRILEATGFVVFALGLLALTAVGYYLAQHFARTTAEPTPQDPSSFVDVPRPQFGFLSTRLDPIASEPTASLGRVADADPENDVAKALLIEKERLAARDGEVD